MELERLEALGIPRDELFRGVTADAAAAWGWDDRGWVEEGLRSDLLVVAGDPLADLGVLREPSWVIVDGVAREPAEILADGLAVSDGSLCLDAGTCATGEVCDRAVHRCAASCSVDSWPYDATCGPAAFCAWADEVAPPLVCREVRGCDPYDGASCDEVYDETSTPSGVCPPALAERGRAARRPPRRRPARAGCTARRSMPAATRIATQPSVRISRCAETVDAKHSMWVPTSGLGCACDASRFL